MALVTGADPQALLTSDANPRGSSFDLIAGASSSNAPTASDFARYSYILSATGSVAVCGGSNKRVQYLGSHRDGPAHGRGPVPQARPQAPHEPPRRAQRPAAVHQRPHRRAHHRRHRESVHDPHPPVPLPRRPRLQDQVARVVVRRGIYSSLLWLAPWAIYRLS